jgi:hypothetical protein
MLGGMGASKVRASGCPEAYSGEQFTCGEFVAPLPVLRLAAGGGHDRDNKNQCSANKGARDGALRKSFSDLGLLTQRYLHLTDGGLEKDPVIPSLLARDGQGIRAKLYQPANDGRLDSVECQPDSGSDADARRILRDTAAGEAAERKQCQYLYGPARTMERHKGPGHRLILAKG